MSPDTGESVEGSRVAVLNLSDLLDLSDLLVRTLDNGVSSRSDHGNWVSCEVGGGEDQPGYDWSKYRVKILQLGT